MLILLLIKIILGGTLMKNFIFSFLSIVISFTAGMLIINNNIDIISSVFLLLILIGAITILIIVLYCNYKIKPKK